jgi:hypothetical protein
VISIRRIGTGPIIHQGMDDSLGDNINGPSLVRVPDWVERPLGRYYLYFAHHEGRHIRLAYADALEGPWCIHRPGALHLSQTPLPQDIGDAPQPAWAVAAGVNGLYAHVASPDVHIDSASRRWSMYFHGMLETGDQVSLVATSADGLDWQVVPGRIAQVYLRVFAHRGTRYALAWAGQVLRGSGDGFEFGPWPFPEGHRHSAVLVRGDWLHVFWTRIGDAPERILHSRIDLKPDWRDWRIDATGEVLRPELGWEGADLPATPSRIGTAPARENGLRDPCFFEEDGRLYLVYAGGGEHALGLAEVTGL